MKVANRATFRDDLAEGDNKSLQRFALRFLSPIVKISLTLHFATLSAERAPFVAPRHFPRFIGEIYPEGGSENLASPKTTTLKSMATLKNRTACGSQSAAGERVGAQRRNNDGIIRFYFFKRLVRAVKSPLSENFREFRSRLPEIFKPEI